MKFYVALVIVVVLEIFVVCKVQAQEDLPSYITKCNRKNYEQCVLSQHKRVIQQLQYGSKDLSFPNMNPYHVEAVRLKTGDLDMKMTNVQVYGLNETTIQRMRYDFDKLIHYAQFYNRELVMDGDCEMKGRISILNLEGKGRLKMALSNFAREKNAMDKIQYMNVSRVA